MSTLTGLPAPDSMRPPTLTGTAAVVTGGGTGIGAALAGALADHGATVWLVGRREEPLRATAAAIGAAARVYVGDITDPDSMAGLADAVAGEFDALHTLVNNASILGPRRLLEEVTPDEFARVLHINGYGTFVATRALLPLLKVASPEANVVTLSSSVGRQGRATWGPYAASKFVQECLSQTWAEELAEHGVRCNALNPGGTRTAMRAEAKPEEDPLTLPTPDSIVPSLLYLLSPDARGITGRSLDSRDF